MLKIKISGQHAKKYNDTTIVSDAINFVPIEFEFDETWDGLSKTYQFSNTKSIDNIDVVGDSNVVNIPHEVLVEGILLVKIVGTKLDEIGETIEIKATTNPVDYKVEASKLVAGTNSRTPTPEVIDQIRQEVNDSSTKSENALTTVTEVKAQTDALLTIKDDVTKLKDDTQLIFNGVKEAETNIIEVVDNFVTKEEERQLAEQGRIDADELREQSFATEIQNAQSATQSANTAAQNASQYVDKLNSKIKSSTFIATANNTTNIVHNLAFNPAKDDLVVSYKGILLNLTDNYTHNSNNISIDLDWSINTGEKVMFRLYKDVK